VSGRSPSVGGTCRSLGTDYRADGATRGHQRAPFVPEPRVNFLLVAMVVLIWFMMNHHNLFTLPP
jgi:hypothetical protein